MNAEIELKLLVSPQDHDSLIKNLNKLPNTSYCKSDFLFNHYFDTSTLQLAQWDMGLRVRGSKNHQEQTLKTAGSVINGLHSRPEYNVSTAEKTPNLFLFPEHIWPEGAVIAALNSALMTIFDTNFTRQTWIVNLNQSKIEVALDSGEVITPKNNGVISELEFELIEGNSVDLILLGLIIVEYIPLRLGQQSKALTGYLLSGRAPYQLNTNWPTELDNLKSSAYITPEALKTLLKMGLEHWLQLESALEYMANLIDSESHPLDELHNQQLTDTLARTALYLSTFEQLLRCIMLISHAMLQHKVCSEQLKQDTQPLTALINRLIIDLTAIPNCTPQLPNQAHSSLACIENLWQLKSYGKLQLTLMLYLTC
jgi:triphosphatase